MPDGSGKDVVSGTKTFDKPAGLAEALRRIAKAKELGSEELDLGALELSEVPAALYELSALKQLYLNSNQLTSLPLKLFTSLARLELLDLSVNQLRELSGDLAGLQALRTLCLNSNHLKTLPGAPPGRKPRVSAHSGYGRSADVNDPSELYALTPGRTAASMGLVQRA